VSVILKGYPVEELWKNCQLNVSRTCIFGGVGCIGVKLPGTLEVWCSRLCIEDRQLKAADGAAGSDEDGHRVNAEHDGRCQRSRRQQKGWLLGRLFSADYEILGYWHQMADERHGNPHPR